MRYPFSEEPSSTKGLRIRRRTSPTRILTRTRDLSYWSTAQILAYVFRASFFHYKHFGYSASLAEAQDSDGSMAVLDVVDNRALDTVPFLSRQAARKYRDLRRGRSNAECRKKAQGVRPCGQVTMNPEQTVLVIGQWVYFCGLTC